MIETAHKTHLVMLRSVQWVHLRYSQIELNENSIGTTKTDHYRHTHESEKDLN